MADFVPNFNLEDALTDTVPKIEPQIKRDFISMLEAEPFDDVIGETCDKVDYVPLLDGDETKEPKHKPNDGGPEDGSRQSVLENGEHSAGDASQASGECLLDFTEPASSDLDLFPAQTGATRHNHTEPPSGALLEELPPDHQKPEGKDLLSEKPVDTANVVLGDKLGDAQVKYPFVVTEADPNAEIWQPTAEEQLLLGPNQPAEPGADPDEVLLNLLEAPAPVCGLVEVTGGSRLADSLDAEEMALGDKVSAEPSLSVSEAAAGAEQVPESSSQPSQAPHAERSDVTAPEYLAVVLHVTESVDPLNVSDISAQPGEPPKDVVELRSEDVVFLGEPADQHIDTPASPAEDAPGSLVSPVCDDVLVDVKMVEGATSVDEVIQLDVAEPAQGVQSNVAELLSEGAVSGLTPLELGPESEVTPEHPEGAETAVISALSQSAPDDVEVTTQPPPESSGTEEPSEGIQPDLTEPHSEDLQSDALEPPSEDLQSDLLEPPSEDLQSDVLEPPSEGSELSVTEPCNEGIASELSSPLGQEVLLNQPEQSQAVPPMLEATPTEEPVLSLKQELGQLQPALLETQGKPDTAEPPHAAAGSDITSPPSKELPASPEKKVKVLASSPSGKTAAAKGKPAPVPSPKKPVTSAPTPKKLISPSVAPTTTSTPRRPLASAGRPSTATPKEAKNLNAKSPVKTPDKKPLTPKPAPVSAPRPAVKASPAATRVTTSTSNTEGAAAPKATTPKRPTSTKIDVKPVEAKKTTRSPTELTRTKPVPADSAKSNGAAPASAGIASSRPKPTKPAAPKTGSAPAASDPKKLPPASRSAPVNKTSAAAQNKTSASAAAKPGAAPKQPRPATAPAADLKSIRSKIGSINNVKNKPEGGKAKIEKKTVPVGTAARKPVPPAGTKSSAPKESAPKGTNEKVQIISKKVNYSHVQSKCGSKDNIKHVPGGGNVPQAAKPTAGSARPQAPGSHKPGSANVQIVNKKIDVSKVSSKCGSKVNTKPKSGAADAKPEASDGKAKKPEAPKAAMEGKQEDVRSAGGEPVTTPQNGVLATPPETSSEGPRENGVGDLVSLEGGDQRENPSLNSLIPETSI